MTLPIVDRIMACCVDWNGQPMHPREEPRSIPDCGDLQEAADAIERLVRALQEAVCLIPASQKTALAKFNAVLAKFGGDASNTTEVNREPAVRLGGDA